MLSHFHTGQYFRMTGGWRCPVMLLAVFALSACSAMDDDPASTATPGDQFVVVTAAAGQPAPSFTYVVQEGDTLSGIANFTGASEAELISLNKLDDPNAIYVGQKLIVPTPSP